MSVLDATALDTDPAGMAYLAATLRAALPSGQPRRPVGFGPALNPEPLPARAAPCRPGSGGSATPDRSCRAGASLEPALR